MLILWGDSDWKYSNFFLLLKDKLLFLRNRSEMTGKILETIGMKNTVLRNGWGLLRHVFGYLKEALIRCQPDSYVLLVAFLPPFLFRSCPVPRPPPPFACPNNNWKIALRRLYMEHIMNIDIELMLVVKSLEEQESCLNIKPLGEVTESRYCQSVLCCKFLGLDTGRPRESTSSLPFSCFGMIEGIHIICEETLWHQLCMELMVRLIQLSPVFSRGSSGIEEITL